MQTYSLGNMSLWVSEFPTVVMISIFECRIKIGFKIRHSVRPENHYHFAYRTFCIRNDKQRQNVIYKKKAILGGNSNYKGYSKMTTGNKTFQILRRFLSGYLGN